MKITVKDRKAKVYTPYNAEFVAAIKGIGGSKWDPCEKCWTVPECKIETVRGFMVQCYGESDISNDVKKVDVEVTFTDDAQSPICKSINMYGKTVARAWGRDTGAKIGEDVTLLHGEITSGGSRANWRTIIKAGAVLVINGVPETMLEAEPEYDVTVHVIEKTDIDSQALEEEKEKLLARIAEIDRLLQESQPTDPEDTAEGGEEELSAYEIIYGSNKSGLDSTVESFDGEPGQTWDVDEMFEVIETLVEHMDEDQMFKMLQDGIDTRGYWKIDEIRATDDEDIEITEAGSITCERLLEMYEEKYGKKVIWEDKCRDCWGWVSLDCDHSYDPEKLEEEIEKTRKWYENTIKEDTEYLKIVFYNVTAKISGKVVYEETWDNYDDVMKVLSGRDNED